MQPIKRLFCVFVVTCFGFMPLFAQVSTAELSGTFTDPTGAPVPGVKVTVTKADTGISRQTISDAAGNYLFTALQPGVYNLAAESTGFKRSIQNGFELQVNQRAEINLKLELGNVSESVEVNAAPPLLETQSSSLGAVTNTELVADLPLNGRNFVQLATLAPGANGTGYSVSGTIMSGTRPDDRRPGSEVFTNGNREGSNDFLYDGVDNNDRLTLSIVLRPPIEAIKEFKVQTNLYSADLGRNSGAAVDVVTKSGTNAIHGSAFEFLRNSWMDARSYFDAKPSPFPSFRYNQFGGSLGGPVILPKYNGKNKTFFFIDYEGYRRGSLNTLVVTIPTLADRTGNFSGIKNTLYDPSTTIVLAGSNPVVYTRMPFAGNIIPPSRFDPLAATLISAYPQPMTSGLANNYTSNTIQSQGWDQGDIRLDHQFSPNDTFFSRWSRQVTTTTIPATYPATTLPGISQMIALGNEDSFAGTDVQGAQQAVASYVHIFSPRLLNEARIGFARFTVDYIAQGAAPGLDLGSKFGIANSNDQPLQTAFPVVSPANYEGIGQSRSLPIIRFENTYQVVDNVTYTLGLHTLKFGEDYRRRQITEYQTNQGNGRFNFSAAYTDLPSNASGGDSMASFLLGLPTLIEQDFMLAYPGLRGRENGIYFADDWRVNSRLTLNMGIRWEYYSPYSEVANREANFNPATVTMQVAGQAGVSSFANVQSDWKDFAPRFGFAYQVLSHTVVRGGFGLFYNPNGNGGVNLRLERTPPYGPIYLVNPGDLIPGQTFSQGLPAAPTVNLTAAETSPSGAVLGVAGNFKNAYAEQYNLTIEQELGSLGALLRVAYVGNLGRRLGTTWNLNTAVPGPGTNFNVRRPFYNTDPNLGDVTYSTSDGLSNYNALQVSVDKRLTKGLTALLGYTYSHAIDDVATDFGGGTGTPQNVLDRFGDRGNSAFDLRQRFTLSYTYSLPGPHKGAVGYVLGGWQLNGILISQTGLPFTPAANNSTVNNNTSSRPNCIANPTLSSPTLSDWFNLTAFATPAPYTYGNCGRDILFGPGRTNFDQSLFKDFRFFEKLTMQFRAEAFNIFNHPQFGQPNATVPTAAAGTITSIVGNPRELQVSARFVF
jgi:hypothetical protein